MSSVRKDLTELITDYIIRERFADDDELVSGITAGVIEKLFDGDDLLCKTEVEIEKCLDNFNKELENHIFDLSFSSKIYELLQKPSEKTKKEISPPAKENVAKRYDREQKQNARNTKARDDPGEYHKPQSRRENMKERDDKKYGQKHDKNQDDKRKKRPKVQEYDLDEEISAEPKSKEERYIIYMTNGKNKGINMIGLYERLKSYGRIICIEEDERGFFLIEFKECRSAFYAIKNENRRQRNDLIHYGWAKEPPKELLDKIEKKIQMNKSSFD